MKSKGSGIAHLRRPKERCKYWKACMDYKLNKELCVDGEWVYCITYQRLEKKNDNSSNKSN